MGFGGHSDRSSVCVLVVLEGRTPGDARCLPSVGDVAVPSHVLGVNESPPNGSRPFSWPGSGSGARFSSVVIVGGGGWGGGGLGGGAEQGCIVCILWLARRCLQKDTQPSLRRC